jgi:hypothetical protein
LVLATGARFAPIDLADAPSRLEQQARAAALWIELGDSAALTLNAWAVNAGVSRTVWANIRRHGNPSRRTLKSC